MTMTREEEVSGQAMVVRGAGDKKQRYVNPNEANLRKKTDMDQLGQLSNIKTKGGFSLKHVEDNLVVKVCDALQELSAKELFRKQPLTLEGAIDYCTKNPGVLKWAANVATAYQARNADGEHHRVLLPLDPLDRDQNQADLAIVVSEVVRRIPELVPGARGTYEPVCIGFGDRPKELAAPAQFQTGGDNEQT